MKHQVSAPTDPSLDPPAGCRPDELVHQMLHVPLFSGIDAGEVRAILALFDEQRFSPGHRITLEGLRGSDFFVILDGEAKVTVDETTVARLQPGDFFGELGVLGDGLRFATVAAVTPLRCLVLPHGHLKRLLVDHPQMSVNVLGEVVSRFKDLAGAAPQA